MNRRHERKKAIEAKKRKVIKDCFHAKKQEGLNVKDPQNIAICLSKSGLNKTDKLNK